MKVKVDLEICQGHGKCYLTSPNMFTPNEEDDWGRPVVLHPDVAADDADLLQDAQRAVAGCPEQAISIS